MKTYNLTRTLPALFVLLALLLVGFLMTLEYRQTARDTLHYAEVDLRDSGHQLADSIEYALANDAQGQVRSDVRRFMLRESAEFSALVNAEGEVLFASNPAWERRPANEVLPETAQQFLNDDNRRVRSASIDSKLLIAIPVSRFSGEALQAKQSSTQLILQDDLQSRLGLIRQHSLQRVLPLLLITSLLMLISYAVIRRLIVLPLQTLQALAKQLKLQNFALSNPLTGDSIQQRLGDTLVDAAGQIQQHIGQIQDREQRLSVTLDAIGDAVIVTDSNGCITRLNSKAEQLTGWQQTEAVGQPLSLVFDIVNASSGQPVANPVEQALTTGQVVELANHTLLKSRSGEQFHISDSAAPIRDQGLPAGDIIGVILVFQDVSSQYRLREQLRENVEFLQNLMRISPSVTYVFEVTDNPQQRFHLSFVSDSVLTHSGYNSQYWLDNQDRWVEHVHPDDLDDLHELLAVLANKGGSACHELRYRHHDGHYVTIQNHLAAVTDQEGRVEKIICNSVDISTQKQALERSRWLGDILDRSLNEIYIFDAQTLLFTQVNRGACENLGYTLEELQSLTPMDIKHDLNERQFRQLIEPLLAGNKQRIRFESVHYRKDGSRYPVRVDLQLDGRGEQARFVALAEDYSEQYQQQHQLREERTLLRRIIDSSPDLIFCKDVDGVYIRCNQAFANYFGHPEADIIGKTDADFVDADTEQRFRRHDQLMLQKGHSHINQEQITYPDGRTALLETLKTPLRSANGEIKGILGISRDITLQRQAEQDQLLAAMVFKNSQEAVMITDANNRIIKVNPAFTNCSGYLETEVIGKNPRILSSGAQDTEFYSEMWQALERDHGWSGEIWNRRKNGDIFLQWLSISKVHDSEGNLQNYVAIMSDLTKFREAENTISFLAQHDVLTKLPNRSLLKDRIRQAMISADRHSQKLALLYLDLDRFKFINDSLGHAVGDELLIAVAERLIDRVRQEDTVCRTGGDEFIVLLPDTDAQGAAHVAEKLVEAMAVPFTIRKNPLFATVSIGISIYPDNGPDAETLNKHADTAMYRAKQAGRNQYQFFTEEMHAQMVHRLNLEHALRSAMDQHQMHLVYQPQFDLSSHKITGCEALLRWQHPEQGLVSPLEFIPIAEETGLINKIGDWVLNKAIGQCQHWVTAGYSDMVVAVNLSAIQFNNPQLVAGICQILEQHQLPARHLELEITESVAMMDINLTIRQLRAIAEQGIKLSLDDFGTGYSSLSYLKQFPINTLKIDQSFVIDMLDDDDDAAIVDAIITLARSLGLKTLAEGVETAEHLDQLKRRGCDYAQGYYLSRPVDADRLSQLLATSGKAGHTEDKPTGYGAEP